MDPVLTILNILDPESSTQCKKESRAALRDWYAKGGFHPTFKDVHDLLHLKPWFRFVRVGYLLDLGVKP